MICRSCGAYVNDNEAFCGNCGAKQVNPDNMVSDYPGNGSAIGMKWAKFLGYFALWLGALYDGYQAI